MYAHNINLNLKSEEKIKTFSGGIFSILTLIISFFVTYLFRKDLYYRTNPKSLTEIKSPLNQTYLKIQDLEVAWRFEDNLGAELNITNIIYIFTF